MPIRVTFIADDDAGIWVALDWTFDAIFMCDIIVTFFSAYFDDEDNIVIKRKVRFHLRICNIYNTNRK